MWINVVAHSGQLNKSQWNKYVKDMTSGLMDVDSDEITDNTCDSGWYFACQDAKAALE